MRKLAACIGVLVAEQRQNLQVDLLDQIHAVGPLCERLPVRVSRSVGMGLLPFHLHHEAMVESIDAAEVAHLEPGDDIAVEVVPFGAGLAEDLHRPDFLPDELAREVAQVPVGGAHLIEDEAKPAR